MLSIMLRHWITQCFLFIYFTESVILNRVVHHPNEKIQCLLDIYRGNLTYQLSHPVFNKDNNGIFYEVDVCNIKQKRCQRDSDNFTYFCKCHRQSSHFITCDFTLLNFPEFLFKVYAYDTLLHFNASKTYPLLWESDLIEHTSSTHCNCYNVKYLLEDDFDVESIAGGVAVVKNFNNYLESVDETLLSYRFELFDENEDFIMEITPTKRDHSNQFELVINIPGLELCTYYVLNVSFVTTRCILAEEGVSVSKGFLYEPTGKFLKGEEDRCTRFYSKGKTKLDWEIIVIPVIVLLLVIIIVLIIIIAIWRYPRCREKREAKNDSLIDSRNNYEVPSLSNNKTNYDNHIYEVLNEI